MGIEVNGVAVASSYQSQTSQAAKPVSQVGGASTATDKGNEVVADTAKSAVSSAAVAVGQASESEKNGNNDAQKEQQKQASMGDVKDIRKVLNNNTIAEFGYNEPTNRITIKIKDKDTNEVIKEIPSEKALEMLAKAWELAGIMVDERR